MTNATVTPSGLSSSFIFLTNPTVSTPLGPPAGYANATLLYDEQFKTPNLNNALWNAWVGTNQFGRYSDYPYLPVPYSGANGGAGGPGSFTQHYTNPYPYYGTGTDQTGLNSTMFGGNGLQMVAFPNNYFSSLDFAWASAGISSYGKMELPATGGYLQVQAMMPDSTVGAWAGIWMESETSDNGANEFDLQESGYLLGATNPNHVLSTTWHGNAGGQLQHTFDAGFDLSQSYNVWGLEYRPAQWFKLYFNGALMATWTSNIPSFAYEVLLDLEIATSAASGYHTVADATVNAGPFVYNVAAVQIYALPQNAITTSHYFPTLDRLNLKRDSYPYIGTSGVLLRDQYTPISTRGALALDAYAPISANLDLTSNQNAPTATGLDLVATQAIPTTTKLTVQFDHRLPVADMVAFLVDQRAPLSALQTLQQDYHLPVGFNGTVVLAATAGLPVGTMVDVIANATPPVMTGGKIAAAQNAPVQTLVQVTLDQRAPIADHLNLAVDAIAPTSASLDLKADQTAPTATAVIIKTDADAPMADALLLVGNQVLPVRSLLDVVANQTMSIADAVALITNSAAPISDQVAIAATQANPIATKLVVQTDEQTALATALKLIVDEAIRMASSLDVSATEALPVGASITVMTSKISGSALPIAITRSVQHDELLAVFVPATSGPDAQSILAVVQRVRVLDT